MFGSSVKPKFTCILFLPVFSPTKYFFVLEKDKEETIPRSGAVTPLMETNLPEPHRQLMNIIGPIWEYTTLVFGLLVN